MDRKTITGLAAGAAALASGCYLAGLLAQLLRNYDLWRQGGGRLGSGASPGLPGLGPADALRGLFTFPYGLYALAFTVAALFLLLFFGLRVGRDGRGDYDSDRHLTYSPEGTYGTAGFMTEIERKQVLALTDAARCQGVILGKRGNQVLSLPPGSRMNDNVIVYGSSGSRKSRSYVRNRVFQAVVRGESLIVTDCKGEIYEMSGYLRAHGYTIRVFNLVEPDCSDSWDCLGEIHGDDLMAQVFASVIIQNSNNGRSDRFWDDAEQNLLKALLLYVDQEYSAGQRTLAAVYDLLTGTAGLSLEAIGQQLPAGHPAKPCFNTYLQSSDSVRAGAITGLAGRLQTLQNRSIRSITSYPEIDLTLPGKELCAYFCITSDQDSTFEFLSSLFFSFLFIKLVRYADHCPGGQLPVPVHILGEELMNCGKIHDLGRRCSVIRSRRVSLSVILQGLGQLQNRYPDNEWVEIIGNADTTLFLGCTDDITARMISDRAGEITVAYSTDAEVYNKMQLAKWSPQYRESHSVGKRKLLTVDEVLRLQEDQELILLRGQKVLRAEKFDYTLHPHARLLTPVRAADHLPAWRRCPHSASEAPSSKPKSPSASRNPRQTPCKAEEEPLRIVDARQLFL